MSNKFTDNLGSQPTPSDVNKHHMSPINLNEQIMADDISGAKKLWESEYNAFKVIPSSTRALPSKALLLFSEILNFENVGKVLDAGCGIGRNSVYLAQKGCEVHAVDFSETALTKVEDLAMKAGVKEKITTYNCLLTEPFPFRESSFDLVLDSYVFCHFTNNQFKENYRKELYRMAKLGGIVFSSVFSFDDEYYKEIIENKGQEGNTVTDPYNGITKYLYTEKGIKDFFSVDFKILYFVKFEFDDVVLDRTYRRSIFVLVLKK